MQSKSREADNGHSTEAYLRYLLGNLDPYQLLTILSLGRPNKSKAPAEVAALLLRSCGVRPSDGNAEDKCRYVGRAVPRQSKAQNRVSPAADAGFPLKAAAPALLEAPLL